MLTNRRARENGAFLMSSIKHERRSQACDSPGPDMILQDYGLTIPDKEGQERRMNNAR
jgi:hypothetical protein